jgi:plasmid stabilization system protein ParE
VSYRLSAEAAEDLADIFRYLRREAGPLTAERMIDRLERSIDRLSAALTLGHARSDVHSRRPLLFLVERPYVIAFDPELRIVIRIVHGARDFTRLFQ